MSMDQIRQRATDGLGDFDDEIAGLTADVRRSADQKVKSAKNALKMGLGKARKQSREALNRARDGAADVYDEVDSLMRERPLVTLAIGLAVGAALALAVGRLLDRD